MGLFLAIVVTVICSMMLLAWLENTIKRVELKETPSENITWTRFRDEPDGVRRAVVSKSDASRRYAWRSECIADDFCLMAERVIDKYQSNKCGYEEALALITEARISAQKCIFQEQCRPTANEPDPHAECSLPVADLRLGCESKTG